MITLKFLNSLPVPPRPAEMTEAWIKDVAKDEKDKFQRMRGVWLHAKAYGLESRAADIRIDEVNMYLDIWDAIQKKGYAWDQLSNAEKNELLDCWDMENEE